MSSLERNYEKELPVHIDTSEQCSRYKLEATKSLLRLHLLHSCNMHSYTSNVNRTLLQLQTQLYKIRKWQLSSYMQIEFDTLFQIITQSLIAWWQSHFYQTLTLFDVQKDQVLTSQHSYVSSSILATSDFFTQTILLFILYSNTQHSSILFLSYWRNKLTIVNSSIHHYLGLIREG